MRLTLIRHGHTVWNGLGRYQGHAQTPLSERGLAQADAVALALRALRGEVAALYSSDLLRCRQTAAPAAEALALDVRYDPRFRETNYGHWQGLTKAELADYDGERYAAFRADPQQVAIPGGESYGQMAARVIDGVRVLLDAHPGDHALLVTHGGPIRELLRHFGLWDASLPTGNASRTVLDISPNGHGADLLAYADMAHLPPSLQPQAGDTHFLA